MKRKYRCGECGLPYGTETEAKPTTGCCRLCFEVNLAQQRLNAAKLQVLWARQKGVAQ